MNFYELDEATTRYSVEVNYRTTVKKFKEWVMLEDEWDRLMSQYQNYEPQMLTHPDIKKELETQGQVRIRTIQQALNIPEGLANFLQREFNKRHKNEVLIRVNLRAASAAHKRELVDSYLYHITPLPHLEEIITKGLMPGQPSLMTNYETYSRGKIFLTDKGGISYWIERVKLHWFHNTEEADVPIAVLRIAKDDLGQRTYPDQRGTDDAKHPSYYVTEKISPQQLERVK